MPIPINCSEWKATALIDFITIAFPSKLKTIKDVSSLKWNGKGTIQCAKKFGRYHGHGCDWLTIHDPDREALQFLIDSFPNTEVIALEVSIDLRPRNPRVSFVKLYQAHAWLTKTLFPQRHRTMVEVSCRKQYDTVDKKIKKIPLTPVTRRNTVYWENQTTHEKVKLYVKTEDKHISPVIPSTRIEITLDRGGCQNAELTRLTTLPSLAPRLRRYLSPFFDVACAIQPKIRRNRTTTPLKRIKAEHRAALESERTDRNWRKYGATWAAKHHYRALPDREVNRMIGGALNALRRDLMKLKSPS